MKDDHLVVSEIFGPTDVARFKRFYVEGAPNECWPWLGAYSTRPVFWFRGMNFVAARFALMLKNGYIPEQALHTCDDGRCVNPDHLYDGSHADNMRDREARNRHAHKPTSPKLTMEQAREIRAWYGPPRLPGTRQRPTYSDVAWKYGISEGQVSALIRGTSYREEVRTS